MECFDNNADALKDVCTADITLNTPLDREEQEVLRNGDGFFLTVSETGFVFNVPETDSSTIYVFGYLSTQNYFSAPLGIPLQCAGTTCSNATDDNILLSAATGNPAGTPAILDHNFADVFFFRRQAPEFTPFLNDWQQTSSLLGRFTTSVRTSSPTGGYPGGFRCATSVEYPVP